MNARRAIWTKNHGEIPKGWVSLNLNGQPSDLRVENIAVVPRSKDLRLIIAPFIERIKRLEREISSQKTRRKINDN
jgi:hypothetical protein